MNKGTQDPVERNSLKYVHLYENREMLWVASRYERPQFLQQIRFVLILHGGTYTNVVRIRNQEDAIAKR